MGHLGLSRDTFTFYAQISGVKLILKLVLGVLLILILHYLFVHIAALLVGRPRDRFPVVSLDFSVTYSFRPFHGPGVDSAPSENEYPEHFLGVKWG